MIIARSSYRNSQEEQCIVDLRKVVFCEKLLYEYYARYVETAMIPDLLGKTICVSAYQYRSLHKLVVQAAALLNMPVPSVHIYEDFYYGAEIKGLKEPRIMISAKTVSDFNESELLFILGKQLGHITNGHHYWQTICEQYLKAIDQLNQMPIVGNLSQVGGIDAVGLSFKIVMYKWSRISEYTGDACGYLISGDIGSCVSVIKNLILNNRKLADGLDLSEYLKQADAINNCDEIVARLSKNDEMVPYGPFRIMELIRFASCEKTKIMVESM